MFYYLYTGQNTFWLSLFSLYPFRGYKYQKLYLLNESPWAQVSKDPLHSRISELDYQPLYITPNVRGFDCLNFELLQFSNEKISHFPLFGFIKQTLSSRTLDFYQPSCSSEHFFKGLCSSFEFWKMKVHKVLLERKICLFWVIFSNQLIIWAIVTQWIDILEWGYSFGHNRL